MQALELKIPPVALLIFFALLMWLGAANVSALDFQFPFPSTIIAWGLGISGILICALGVSEFQRAKTTVNPTKPQFTSSLVRTGIYRRTRNPMYLGFLLILLGLATAMANVLAFLLLPVFVIYMTQFQIKPEERALTSIFGDDYKAYCANVRRWI